MSVEFSILLVNLNNLEFTKNCLSDLLTQDIPFNLKIIDQKSTENGTLFFFEEFYNSYINGLFSKKINHLEIIKNNYNKPLNHIWNEFVDESLTEYICLLNNDVRLSPNFLSSSLKVLQKEPSVGFVNHVTNNLTYSAWSNSLEYMIMETPYRQGWDPIFRKSSYNQIPENLNFFYGDDFIYSKLYESGYKGAYILNSPMIHFERSTTIEKGGQRDCSDDGSVFHSLNLEHKNLTFNEDLCRWKPEFNVITKKENNNREIFIILYHKSTNESLSYLRALIHELNTKNKKFIICSHSTIPEDIIDMCESYVYDSNNIIVTNPNNYSYWLSTGNFTIVSPFLFYGSLFDKNYGLASIKNFLNGMSISFQLGYEILHFLEYDCIPNFDCLTENSNILNDGNFDAVVYKNIDNEMLGNVFTCSSKKYLNTNWLDIDYWLKFYEKNDFFSEKTIFNMFNEWYGVNRVLSKPKENQPHGNVSSLNQSSFLQSVLYEENNNLTMFLTNQTSNTITNITIYFTNGKKNISLHGNQWIILTLGNKENIKFVDIFVNNTVIRKWDLETEENYNKFVKSNKIIKNQNG
jgi:hypothetical protein